MFQKAVLCLKKRKRRNSLYKDEINHLKEKILEGYIHCEKLQESLNHQEEENIPDNLEREAKQSHIDY